MTTINLPFNKWSKERLATGQKVCTSRTKQYGNPGDKFYVENEHILKEILKFPLWFVKDFLWYQEGANSPEEFEEVWCSIHPNKKFVNDQTVYTHFFTNPQGHPKK